MRLVWTTSRWLPWVLTLGFVPGCSSNEPPAAQEPVQTAADAPPEDPSVPPPADPAQDDAAKPTDGSEVSAATPSDGTTIGELTDPESPTAEPPVPPSDGGDSGAVTPPADDFQEGALDTPPSSTPKTKVKAKAKAKSSAKGRGGDGKVGKGRPHVVTAQVLNVRSGPSRKAKVVRQLEQGAQVKVLEVKGLFAKIGDGEWVRTRHIAKATGKKPGGKARAKGKKGPK